MATKATHEKGTEKVSLSQKINDILVKNRTFLISILVAFLCVMVGLTAVTVINEIKTKGAYETVEQAVLDWEKARSAPDKTGLAAAEDTLIVSLNKTADSNKHSYAGSRAYLTVAEIYFSRKDWKNAQDAYLAAALAAPKTYINGIGYFNAGVCADELGNQDEAVGYFNKTIASEDFTLKSRAYFNIGRIEEQRNNKDAAIASYEKMAEQFPDDEWTLLAKSRVIALQIQ